MPPRQYSLPNPQPAPTPLVLFDPQFPFATIVLPADAFVQFLVAESNPWPQFSLPLEPTPVDYSSQS